MIKILLVIGLSLAFIGMITLNFPMMILSWPINLFVMYCSNKQTNLLRQKYCNLRRK